MWPWQRTVWTLFKKLKIELSYDPVISLLCIYSEKMEPLIQKDTCIPVFIAALFTIAKTQKQPKYPVIDEWIKKIWGVHMLYMCVCIYICRYTYCNMYIHTHCKIYIHTHTCTTYVYVYCISTVLHSCKKRMK